MLRSRSSDRPSLEEYQQRFPEHHELVEALFRSLTAQTAGPPVPLPPAPLSSGAHGTEFTDADPSTVGRYQVVRRLGQGAFGTVYLGRDDDLNRSVAIKVPNPRLFRSPEVAARWLAEARAVAQLDYPGIVPVYDVGRTPDGHCFIVSKDVAGSNLAEFAAASRLSIPQIAEIVAAVGEALHHAHRRGLVHRDVKPVNILIDEAGRPLVTDFGLALRDEDQSQKEGEICGTPAYMAPELVRGASHHLDGRADIWSVGVILYELLTGRRPFTGPDLDQLFDQIQNRSPRPPRMIDDRS